MSIATVSTLPSSRGMTRTSPCSSARSGSSGSVESRAWTPLVTSASRTGSDDRRQGPREEQHAGVVASDRLAVGDEVVVAPARGAGDRATGRGRWRGRWCRAARRRRRAPRRAPTQSSARPGLTSKRPPGWRRKRSPSTTDTTRRRAAEASGEGGGQRMAVADDHDGRRHRSLGERGGDRAAPRRRGEPVVDERRACAARPSPTAGWRVGGVGLDPVALAVERVRRQRQAVALLVGEQRRRVELDAGLPRPRRPRRGRRRRRSAASFGMAQRRRDGGRRRRRHAGPGWPACGRGRPRAARGWGRRGSCRCRRGSAPRCAGGGPSSPGR